jgi:GNAT superfamily N-acetyltransferase
MPFDVRAADGRLEREQAQDLRRSVLCGELHLHRDLVDDGQDEGPGTWLGIAWSGPKPVGTVRLRRGPDAWHVELLAVLPQQRRGGVARALLEAALTQARRDASAPIMAVGPLEASAFFQSQGFVVLAQESGLTVWQKALS